MNETEIKTNVWAVMMNSRCAPLDMTLTAIVVVYGIHELSANIAKGIDVRYSMDVKFEEFGGLQFAPVSLRGLYQ